MIKNAFLVAVLLLSTTLQSQSFFGSQYDNYAGIYSVMNNPANIADSRFKSDINIVSGSFFAGSDYYAVKIGDLLSNSDFEAYAKKTPSDNNNLYTNVDFLGPSFLLNIDDNSTFGFFTRARGIGHASEINGLFLEKIQEDIEEDIDIQNQNFSIATNSWFEVGLSYARILFNNERHFIKGGVSVKYIGGLYSGYIKARNLSITYDYTGLELTNTTTTSGEIETGNISSLENFDDPIDNRGSGFGTDIGFTYELRTNESNANSSNAYNKYLVKFGVSVTDIGNIKFKEGEKVVYEADASYTDAEYAINDDFDSYYTRISESKSFNVSLPTALHFNADWNAYEKFYLNVNTDLNMNKETKPNSNYIKNTFSMTPRYESRWFSIYLPFSVVEDSGFLSGFGFRAGPITLGSGSLFNGLFGYSNAVDVHLGIKIPLYHTDK
ncbi:DUF5723 family protein [Flavobacterium sp. NRK F7]|uniref:DUF5723 family protein n=1 Tax=Flavobacterium sp. NRK F7 TaxID=2954930 RepID=UPI002091B3F2|nr:DUF5723 family protein [Flavobacterium sp. NRK F7]MCO6163643.1 DUF5723 family protein [Flavobacterium sp. NRK F7]